MKEGRVNDGRVDGGGVGNRGRSDQGEKGKEGIKGKQLLGFSDTLNLLYIAKVDRQKKNISL